MEKISSAYQQTQSGVFSPVYIAGIVVFNPLYQPKIEIGQKYFVDKNAFSECFLRKFGGGTIEGVEKIVRNGRTVMQVVQLREIPIVGLIVSTWGFPGDERQRDIEKSFDKILVPKQYIAGLTGYSLDNIVSKYNHAIALQTMTDSRTN